MKHVAFVIPGLDRIGGAERQVILLSRGLLRRGWRVSVVALSGTHARAADDLTAIGVGFLSLEMRKGLADPQGWIRFNRWLRNEKPDILHAHLPHAAWLARWSSVVLSPRIPPWMPPGETPVFIDTLHSSSTGGLGRRLGYRYSRWLPNQVTAVSQSVAEAHLTARMVESKTLSVLPNGVDVLELRPDSEARAIVRRELRLKDRCVDDEFVWLAAGRLEAVKDYPTLLAAFARVAEPALLLIAGCGRLLGELSELAQRLGLRRRVRFLGFQGELKPWMQAADGFVLSSRWEGLPMGLLEAGACGLPSVATNVPGSREAILRDRTGWLTPAGDAAAMAEAMSAAMQATPEKRRAMGEAARRHVVEHFSLEAVLDRWERLYGELLAKRRSRDWPCATERRDRDTRGDGAEAAS